MPPAWRPDSFPTEFPAETIPLWQAEGCLFPYPFQQHAGCLLSLCHDFHSIISTFLLFRETCKNCKARSAWTTALISLSELTTVSLRESTQSEGLHRFKQMHLTTSKSTCTLQTTLAVQVLDSHCWLRSVLQRGNILPPAHVGCGGAQLLQPLPSLPSKGEMMQEHLACPCFYGSDCAWLSGGWHKVWEGSWHLPRHCAPL